ncbi:MAG TPA: hypothetical protein VFX15_13700 [Actinomycetes bacterium]|nr:hypothetical protein [Actinomycetes bacterium]
MAITPGSVRITIDDGQLARFFLPGGDVFKQTRDMGATHYRHARIWAPRRTGNLRDSHDVSVQPNRAYRCQYTLTARAFYADYVHNGTTGPIHADKYSIRNKFFPRKGFPHHLWVSRGRSTYGLMKVRPAPHSWYPVPWLRATVDGQMAQPWIELTFPIAFREWRAAQAKWARSLR